MKKEILKEIGLTDGEIEVYITLLKVGETTTGKIIEQSKISGSKVYVILDKLMKKGLVSFIVKEKTKYFQAASPERIFDYLDEKDKKLMENRRELEKEIPSLIALQGANIKKYETKIYLGYNGIKTVIFEVLKTISKEDEILIMGINLSREEKYNLLWKNWHSERIKKGVGCKMLFSDKDKEYFKIFSKMKKTDVKILQGITPASVGILKDRIILTTYGEEPSCLLIKHPEILKSFRTFFEQLWKIGKK